MRHCVTCGKDYVPNSDMKVRFYVCSEYCRSIEYKYLKQTKDIEAGNYDSYRVAVIKARGYKVTVTKVES